MNPVTALKRWLSVVGVLRLLSVYIGVFHHKLLQKKLFDKQTDLVHELYGRTFAAWTVTTCGLCFICARNPRSRTIYGATLLSFLVALVFFLNELLVFKTISLRNAAIPMSIAGVSSLWMAAGWNYYTISEAPLTSEEQEGGAYEETAEQKQD